MPGYVKTFKKLSEKEQRKDIEKKVDFTRDNILDIPAYRKAIKKRCGTDRSEWDVDTCDIESWTIDNTKAEVRAVVHPHACRTAISVLQDSVSQEEFTGRVAAIISDDGEVRYEPITKTTPQPTPPEPPKRSRKRFPFGSEEWIVQHSNLDWWLDAEDSTAKYQNFSKKYHVEINEYVSGWAYNIMPYGNHDNLLDHKGGYETIEDVIDAALRSLVKIWNAAR